MPQHSNRFNERFLRRRLEENNPNLGFEVKDPNREELQYTTMYQGIMFLINRGHAYRDHATGPSTNPRYGGPPEVVEAAIIEDAFKRWKKGMLNGNFRIASGGPGIIFRHIPIRYNAIEVDGTIQISDYMLWQGTVGEGATWEVSISQDWLRYG